MFHYTWPNATSRHYVWSKPDIWGWHEEHSEPASILGLLTVWSLWGNPGMARCQEISTLLAGYIPQRKVTSGSSSGSLGIIVCVKCCRMVDIVYQDTDYLYLGQYSRLQTGWYCLWGGSILYIPEKQVLVRSWLWKIYLYIRWVL